MDNLEDIVAAGGAKVDLTRYGLTPEDALRLAQLLHGNTTVQVLDLMYNENLGDEGCTALVHKALLPGTRLRILGLGACGIGPRGAKALAT